ncbi:MAG TPA: hypothetical protein VK593_03990, partial [Edaphobacter sp.]|nr:hypothetical protein [Edaphobacter sp.]
LPSVRDAYACTTLGEPPQPVEDDSLSYDRAFGVSRNTPSQTQRLQPGYAAAEMADSSVMIEEAVPQKLSPQMPLHLAAEIEEEEAPPPDEIERLARVMLTCLIGYIVAGWFLSRAYIMTLFIYGGMVQAVYNMALTRGIAPPRMKPLKVIQYSIAGVFGLLFLVYLMLRFQHLSS